MPRSNPSHCLSLLSGVVPEDLLALTQDLPTEVICGSLRRRLSGGLKSTPLRIRGTE